MVTLIEAAALLGVTPDTLRQQIARGKLRATKRGRDWFVTPSEVRRYAAQHRRSDANRFDTHGYAIED